jgi:transposase InsO family protein
MDDAVKKAFEAKKGRSGSPGLTRDLADAGQHYDRKTVAASMRRQELRAKAAKKFKATTNSKHSLPVAANLLRNSLGNYRIDPNSLGLPFSNFAVAGPVEPAPI